jgi:methylenetetrahydrofolate--tRNA-(uracil-5-)-methyltransferase
VNPNPAQKLKTAAELVCTNSLKSNVPESGHGLLKQEMKALGSVVLEVGYQTAVPAGDALAVDREKFSKLIHEKLLREPLIEFIEKEVADPFAAQKEYGCDYVILATGPLTGEALSNWIQKEICGDDLYFYDAIAPVVDADTIDYSKMYWKDRWKNPEEVEPNYLNIALDEQQYKEFVADLIAAEKVPMASFEKPKYFESCLPIDVMAERGEQTLSFSCMKPVGLYEEGKQKPYAVVQLRKENLLGSAYNLVGFQNRLTYKEQLRVFRKLPGMEKAQFAKLGSIHRNSFINAAKLLKSDLSLKTHPHFYLAGQITGVEGYTESSSMGLYVAFQLKRKIEGKSSLRWPVETGIGALVNYLMTQLNPTPTNINFGLLPSVVVGKKIKNGGLRKKYKKELASKRATEYLANFIAEHNLDEVVLQ